MALDEQQRIAKLKRLRDEFPYYARYCLKIRSKSKKIIPLELNGVQMIVHGAAEQQLAETGRVRLLILKARQPGISTYIEGRFYHKTTHGKGIRTFILTHSDKATSNLFKMVKRFQDNCPAEQRPQTRISNAKELDFGLLDSSYGVGTAKAEGVGRSDTIQLFHGSEAAYWANAEEHASGALQAVPDEAGTEVFLESTANGIGGLFYRMCRAAQRGEGEYRLIFIPWFLHHAYRKPRPKEWQAPPAFAEYGELHGLDRGQLYWAFSKNAEFAVAMGQTTGELCGKFRQEYPATPVEAFQASDENSFIRSELVLRARKFTAPDQDHAPLVLGCDFARGARDWNWFISRRARIAGDEVNDRFHSDDTEDIAGRLARVIDRVDPAMCFLDSGGGGSAVYDILKARGYGDILSLINFGGKASDDRKYANKRAEMWGDGRDWLADAGGAELPDDDVLHSEICAPGFKENANQQIVLEAKEKIRQRLGHSTDGGDAWALTFAAPVRGDRKNRRPRQKRAIDTYDPLKRGR